MVEEEDKNIMMMGKEKQTKMTRVVEHKKTNMRMMEEEHCKMRNEFVNKDDEDGGGRTYKDYEDGGGRIYKYDDDDGGRRTANLVQHNHQPTN